MTKMEICMVILEKTVIRIEDDIHQDNKTTLFLVKPQLNAHNLPFSIAFLSMFSIMYLCHSHSHGFMVQLIILVFLLGFYGYTNVRLAILQFYLISIQKFPLRT